MIFQLYDGTKVIGIPWKPYLEFGVSTFFPGLAIGDMMLSPNAGQW